MALPWHCRGIVLPFLVSSSMMAVKSSRHQRVAYGIPKSFRKDTQRGDEIMQELTPHVMMADDCVRQR